MFVIWFNMYPGDKESRWPHELFTDPRVTQRWDEPKTAGRWFLTHLSGLTPSRGGDQRFPQQVDALWDTYILFDDRGDWKEEPTGLLSWGYTVIRSREKLAQDFRFAARQ